MQSTDKILVLTIAARPMPNPTMPCKNVKLKLVIIRKVQYNHNVILLLPAKNP